MIDDSTEATTAEICLLSGYVKSRLGQLESVGIIKRNGKDCWPLAATMRALVEHARARSAAYSEAKGRMEEARAKALELRVQREEGKVAPVQAWYDALVTIIGKIVTGLDALAPRWSRDVAERKRVDDLICELRTNVADWLEEEAKGLEDAARKSARQRL
jgi:hypothetical protein